MTATAEAGLGLGCAVLAGLGAEERRARPWSSRQGLLTWLAWPNFQAYWRRQCDGHICSSGSSGSAWYVPRERKSLQKQGCSMTG